MSDKPKLDQLPIFTTITDKNFDKINYLNNIGGTLKLSIEHVQKRVLEALSSHYQPVMAKHYRLAHKLDKDYVVPRLIGQDILKDMTKLQNTYNDMFKIYVGEAYLSGHSPGSIAKHFNLTEEEFFEALEYCGIVHED